MSVKVSTTPPKVKERDSNSNFTSDPIEDTENEKLQQNDPQGESYIDVVNKLAVTVDDPEMVVFTFRSVLVGVILSAISASVYQLMMFKPVGIPLTTTFMLIIAYLVCKAMERYLPTGGWLNPAPFNLKEHTCIYVMVSSANTAAYGTLVLGVQQLYYENPPTALGSIVMLLATQLVGYGIAGQLRKALVYPTKMIWPASLPTISLLRTLNSGNEDAKWRTRFFFITFAAIFFYEILPQYMFPLLGGISIACFANGSSVWIQRLFGGLAVNEGLGILQLSFDWNYLSFLSPLVYPLYVQMNVYAGIFILYIMAPLLYYYDVWNARSFPFLSNSLFSFNETTSEAKVYPQHQVLNYDNSLNYTKLEEIGSPHFSTLGAVGYIMINFAVTASVTHVILYHGRLILDTMVSTKNKLVEVTDIHMRLMAFYKEVPNWWYYLLFVFGIVLNIGVSILNGSHLPWWGVIAAIFISLGLSLPLNMIEAVTGRGFGLNVFAEMVGGFLFPGQPVANMYFKTLGYNTLSQAGRLAHDLKIGHYMKIPPRLVFFHQMLGTVIGCFFNYLINIIIVTNQREILLDPQTRSNTWNGAAFQTMNSAAISWGAIGPIAMFGPSTKYAFVLWAFLFGFLLPLPFWCLHRIYPKVGFDLVNVPMILIGLTLLPGAASSYVLVSFFLTILSQWYIKRYRSEWFVKYNFLLSTALDSGTSLMVFFVAFVLMGGGDGNPHPFPSWFGNRSDIKYIDYCCQDCQ